MPPKSQELESEISKILFYPGGDGGGGTRKSSGGSPVVLPHIKTSGSCTLCNRIHTEAEHRRHAGSLERKMKSSGAKKGKGGRGSAKRAFESSAKRTGSPTKKQPPGKRSSAKRPAAARRDQPKASPSVVKRVSAGHSSRTPAPPSLPAPPSPRPADRKEFDRWVLSKVKEVAKGVPRSGRYGKEKIFISEVWKRIEPDGIFPSKDSFFKWLLFQMREGNLQLARADLIGAMPPDLVRDSEIKSYGATFHFLMDPRGFADLRTGEWSQS